MYDPVTHIAPYSLDNNSDPMATATDLKAGRVYTPRLTECSGWTLSNFLDFFEAVDSAAKVLGGGKIGIALLHRSNGWSVLDPEDFDTSLNLTLARCA